jgi:hypothetical protein
MLDENAKAASERFMDKLTKGGFTVARSLNTEQDYTENKQDRDTKAVSDFVGSELFTEIAEHK